MTTQTSLMAEQVRLQQWAEQVLDCKNRPRGMDVETWCAQNNITKANYYYRLRRVRKACLDQMQTEQSNFIERKYVIICTLPLKKTCRPSGGTFYFFFLVRNPSGNSFDHGKSRFRSSGFGKGPILRSSSNT